MILLMQNSPNMLRIYKYTISKLVTLPNLPVLVFEGIMSRPTLQFTAVHKPVEVDILVTLTTQEKLASVEGGLREMFL